MICKMQRTKDNSHRRNFYLLNRLQLGDFSVEPMLLFRFQSVYYCDYTTAESLAI